MFDGGKPDKRYPLPPEVRDYTLAKTFGFNYQEIQEAPAVWLDWLLAIDGIVAKEKE